MAATDLGKVGMVMKGTWSSSATYEVLDAVGYNNGLYIAKQAVPANTAPTNTTYWQLAIDGALILPKDTVTAPANGAVTLGVSSTSPDKVLANSKMFLIVQSSNVSAIALVVRTTSYSAGKEEIYPSVGFTVTVESNNIKIVNTTTYAHVLQILTLG